MSTVTGGTHDTSSLAEPTLSRHSSVWACPTRPYPQSKSSTRDDQWENSWVGSISNMQHLSTVKTTLVCCEVMKPTVHSSISTRLGQNIGGSLRSNSPLSISCMVRSSHLHPLSVFFAPSLRPAKPGPPRRLHMKVQEVSTCCSIMHLCSSPTVGDSPLPASWAEGGFAEQLLLHTAKLHHSFCSTVPSFVCP